MIGSALIVKTAPRNNSPDTGAQASFGQEWTVTGVEFREVDVNAADDGSRTVRS
jgi:hypothetical protein